ncbi:MAG: CBS domain-containing protein [Gammaproteobacteria bacterium]
MKVGEACNRDVVFVKPTDAIRDAALRMREYNVGSVVVVDDSNARLKPIGILTDRDIAVAVLAENVDPDRLTAKDVMKTELITTTTEEGLWEAVKRMSDCGVRRLPVTDDQGSLVGILSLDDLIDLLAESMNNLSLLIKHSRQRERRRQV